MNVLDEIIKSYNEKFPGDVLDDDDYSEVVGEKINYTYSSDKKWAKENNLKLIEGDTGGEGSGEYCYSIFSWKDKVYKIEYSYYSYGGTDYDGVEDTIREVVPVEKLVTVYEDKK